MVLFRCFSQERSRRPRYPRGYTMTSVQNLAFHVSDFAQYRNYLPAICFALLTFSASTSVCMAKAASVDQVSVDLKHRSPAVHWPESPNPGDANVFAHNEIVIDTPCADVWSRLVDAKAWPSWYTNSSSVNLAGDANELRANTEFTWTTFGLTVHSRVNEFVPDSRLGWFADGAGVRAYHAWILLPAGQKCHVVTEEASMGEAIAAARRSNSAYLHKGHAIWLEELKIYAEGQRPGSNRSNSARRLQAPVPQRADATDEITPH
jgi:uncharacterized protein YndB with AHSA1/START domain